MRAKQERVDAISALAARKLGVRASRSRSSRSLDDLTAEEIERDTLSIRRILSVWRQIGKREPPPIHASVREAANPEKLRDRRVVSRDRIRGRAASQEAGPWGAAMIAGYERPWQVRDHLRALECGRGREGTRASGTWRRSPPSRPASGSSSNAWRLRTSPRRSRREALRRAVGARGDDPEALGARQRHIAAPPRRGGPPAHSASQRTPGHPLGELNSSREKLSRRVDPSRRPTSTVPDAASGFRSRLSARTRGTVEYTGLASRPGAGAARPST